MVISIASHPKIQALNIINAISNILLPAKAAAICPKPKIKVDNSISPLIENSFLCIGGLCP